MPLHLYKTFTGILYTGFVGGHDNVLMLHHISVFTGACLDLPVALGAEGIKTVIFGWYSTSRVNAFSSMRWLTMQTCIQQSAGIPA